MQCDVSYDEIVKSVFRNTNVKCSSDLVVCLYAIGKRIDLELMLMLQPIHNIEHLNWHVDVDLNTEYVFAKLDSLNQNERKEAKISYNYLIKFIDENRKFLEVHLMDFSNNNKVEIVSKIRQELLDKKDYCI